MNKEDIESLHNIAYGGLMRAATPDDVAERLLASGRAWMTTAGTLMLTKAGYEALPKPAGFMEMGGK